jgi:hypothetical protein
MITKYLQILIANKNSTTILTCNRIGVFSRAELSEILTCSRTLYCQEQKKQYYQLFEERGPLPTNIMHTKLTSFTNNSILIRPNGLLLSSASGSPLPPPRETSKKTTLLPRSMAAMTAGSGPVCGFSMVMFLVEDR